MKNELLSLYPRPIVQRKCNGKVYSANEKDWPPFWYFQRLACLGMVLDFNLQAMTVNDIYEMTTEGGDA